MAWRSSLSWTCRRWRAKPGTRVPVVLLQVINDTNTRDGCDDIDSNDDDDEEGEEDNDNDDDDGDNDIW